MDLDTRLDTRAAPSVERSIGRQKDNGFDRADHSGLMPDRVSRNTSVTAEAYTVATEIGSARGNLPGFFFQNCSGQIMKSRDMT